MQESVIIVAGGKGNRMNSEIPKQFMILADKPVLQHTLEAFYNYNASISIVLVLPKDQIQTWESLCAEYKCTIPHTIAIGGAERFYSVLSGLQQLQSGVVAIHDGVRPLITKECIARGFEHARTHKSAIPIIDSVDTLRFIDENSNYTISRQTIKRVQTPQIFTVAELKKAYAQEFSAAFTDDASVWESAGNTVSCYAGEELNIKLTTPIDFSFAESICKLRKNDIFENKK